MDDAPTDALTRRVGGSGNRGNRPGAGRGVGDLHHLGNINAKDQGGRSRRRLGGVAVALTLRSGCAVPAADANAGALGVGRRARGGATAHVATQLREEFKLAFGRALGADGCYARGPQGGRESGHGNEDPGEGQRRHRDDDAEANGEQGTDTGDNHAASASRAFGRQARRAAGTELGDIADRLVIATVDDGPNTPPGRLMHALSARHCAPGQERSAGLVARV